MRAATKLTSVYKAAAKRLSVGRILKLRIILGVLLAATGFYLGYNLYRLGVDFQKTGSFVALLHYEWESGAILRYLANGYAGDSFWPADPKARAEVDKWAEWSKLNVVVNFTRPIFWSVVRTLPSQRDPVAIADGLRTLNRFLDIAEVQLATSPYLAGEHLTLADIQFGHCLFRYFDIDIEIERAEHPALRRYYDTLTGRPNYREHVMVSYDELRAED